MLGRVVTGSVPSTLRNTCRAQVTAGLHRAQRGDRFTAAVDREPTQDPGARLEQGGLRLEVATRCRSRRGRGPRARATMRRCASVRGSSLPAFSKGSCSHARPGRDRATRGAMPQPPVTTPQPCRSSPPRWRVFVSTTSSVLRDVRRAVPAGRVRPQQSYNDVARMPSRRRRRHRPRARGPLARRRFRVPRAVRRGGQFRRERARRPDLRQVPDCWGDDGEDYYLTTFAASGAEIREYTYHDINCVKLPQSLGIAGLYALLVMLCG